VRGGRYRAVNCEDRVAIAVPNHPVDDPPNKSTLVREHKVAIDVEEWGTVVSERVRAIIDVRHRHSAPVNEDVVLSYSKNGASCTPLGCVDHFADEVRTAFADDWRGWPSRNGAIVE